MSLLLLLQLHALLEHLHTIYYYSLLKCQHTNTYAPHARLQKALLNAPRRPSSTRTYTRTRTYINLVPSNCLFNRIRDSSQPIISKESQINLFVQISNSPFSTSTDQTNVLLQLLTISLSSHPQSILHAPADYFSAINSDEIALISAVCCLLLNFII